MADDWEGRLGALGAAIRQQRQLAKMSLRQLSELAQVSNPYLSQIERGLHEPSVRVVRSIARALNVSAEELLDQAGMLDEDDTTAVDTEQAIRHDPRLTEAQKDALIGVYRSFLPKT
jgi:transcriptional regulator with XRE-family HTH domain